MPPQSSTWRFQFFFFVESLPVECCNWNAINLPIYAGFSFHFLMLLERLQLHVNPIPMSVVRCWVVSVLGLFEMAKNRRKTNIETKRNHFISGCFEISRIGSKLQLLFTYSRLSQSNALKMELLCSGAASYNCPCSPRSIEKSPQKWIGAFVPNAIWTLFFFSFRFVNKFICVTSAATAAAAAFSCSVWSCVCHAPKLKSNFNVQSNVLRKRKRQRRRRN